MGAEHAVELACAYLATYALHSTLLCAIALWVARRSGLAAPRSVERLLRTALIGGVLTAGVQFGLGFEPIGGRIDFSTPARASASTPSVTPRRTPTYEPEPMRFEPAPMHFERALTSEPSGFASHGPSEPEVELLPLAGPHPDFAFEPAPGRLAQPSAVVPAWRPSWKQLAIGAWLVGIAFGIASALRDVAALRRALRWRTELRGGPVFAALAELCAEAGVSRRVRLSIAPCTHVPLSFGLFRPEIALPPRTLEDLAPDEQRAVLAHELAHLVRRDIAWLWLARAVGVLFCFQPLNRWVARELERRAEFAADRWARGRLGSGESLASALAEIAGWLIAERRALPAAPMARERSQLIRRVEHLLDHDGDAAAEPRSWSVAAPLACAVVAAWAPTFGASAPGRGADLPTDRGAGALGAAEPAFEPAADPAADPAVEASAPSAESTPSASVANVEREHATVASSVVAADQGDTPPDPLEPAGGELDVLELAAAAAPREIFEAAAALLDEEIAALEAELAELGREFAEGEPDLEIEAELALLETRVDALVERRGRLRDLFGALTQELDAASAASPEDTARTATFLESSR